jgi:pimeloyl-ACP methyl ester carboxylesterase
MDGFRTFPSPVRSTLVRRLSFARCRLLCHAQTKRISTAVQSQLILRTPTKGSAMTPPETGYAKSGDVRIAFQLTGGGPFDLVFMPGFVSNLDPWWENPIWARFFSRFAAFSRLILFDKRGTGLSDRISGAPDLETRMDDVRTVMDAVDCERAAVFGVSEGGAMSMLFAATYPERTRALVLYGTYAHYPTWVLTGEKLDAFIEVVETDPRQVAAALIGQISEQQRKEWSNGTPADWAMEAFGLARRDAFGLLPRAGDQGTYSLPAAYTEQAEQDVALQLSRGGVRLAFVLNQALAAAAN